MTRIISFVLIGAAALAGTFLTGCGEDHGHAHGPAAAPSAVSAKPEAEPVSNRIPIPPAVRANLGITFATAEYRVVTATRRFPGRFEPDVDARQSYATSVAGQVDLLVRPYQQVAAGQPLYRLAGRGWAELQREWREAHAEHPGLDEAVVTQRRALVRRSLAQAAGLAVDDPRLGEVALAPTLTVHARLAGTMEGTMAASGAIVAIGDPVMATIDPQRVRLRATALQGDLARMRDGLTCRIVPMSGSPAERLAATMALALEADPVRRTQDLIAWPTRDAATAWPAWARVGLTALLEVDLAGGGDPELAIPTSATIRDGLATIFFRRDPADPDQVIRMEADLGATDGTWVQMMSGLKEGDEVVVEGIYQLKLSGAGKAQLGGHFHSDGTFHADESKGDE